MGGAPRMGVHAARPPHEVDQTPAREATQVEELKELIMRCEPGTGAVARHIKQAKFVPRHNAFTSLLQLASKSRQPEKAIEIFEAMKSIAGIAPNTFSYSALISALAKGGQWQQAERYFDEFRQLGQNGNADMKPNKVTYSAMISAYEKGRQLSKALTTFEEQLADGVEPDIITFSSLLSACEGEGDVACAMNILDKMHALGLAGSAQMYNSIIAMCGSSWKPALEVFLGMQCAGVQVSRQTVNLLMSSLCAGEQRDHALWLLAEVSTKLGWAFSLTAYTALLQMVASRGDCVAADLVHKSMVRHGVFPDATAAGAIIRAHCNGGYSSSVDQLVRHFTSIGISLLESVTSETAKASRKVATIEPDGIEPKHFSIDDGSEKRD